MVQNWIDGLLSKKNPGSLELEKKQLLDASKELEMELAGKKISAEEYDKKNKKLHDKLACIDLGIQIKKTLERIELVVSEESKKLKLNSVRQQRLEESLAKKKGIEKEANEAKDLFEKKKMDLEAFLNVLKEKNSELLDIEEDVKRVFRLQMADRLKQQEILLATAKELESVKDDEIAEDLMIQIPKGEDFEFPKLPTEETKNIAKHRHERRRI